MNDAINGWLNCVVSGFKGFVFFSKVKEVNKRLKSWLVNSKSGSVQPSEIEKSLGLIDRRAAVEGWSDSLKEDRFNLLEEFWKSYRMEEQTQRQKSRIKWLFEGDKNTKFFYSVANGKRIRNFISDVSFKDVTISDPIILRRQIFSFFENHFQKESWQRPKMSVSNLKKPSKIDSLGLEEVFI
ncbi:hypothetical protein Ddye_004373 [Dipteronia dyeriana]|uniref:Uncharacterized protein n=1 Tax=Dipteronia dyeriana TaxID=168575 RepID=A0AAE0CWB6_9ROSI|nr:hypothetical protein Ddye_004373 [Dipteronia dyeriana]